MQPDQDRGRVSQPKKHHFLPVFYLRQWAGEDGRLVQFSKPFGNVVKPRRGHPESMGWMPRLYAREAVAEEFAHRFETLFLSPVDSQAAEALRVMLDPAAAMAFTGTQKLSWARFMNSLLARMPEDIAKLKEHAPKEWVGSIRGLREKYLAHRELTDPPTLDDFLEAPTGTFMSDVPFIVAEVILGHERLQQVIADMHWAVLVTDGADHEMLTSDRPLVHTQSLNARDSHLLLPIGPRRLLAAAHERKFVDYLQGWGLNALVKRVNEYVVGSADRYVFGSHDRQLRFIQNRMSTEKSASLVDRLHRKRSQLSPSANELLVSIPRKP
jgi:hypothetical protein